MDDLISYNFVKEIGLFVFKRIGWPGPGCF